MALAGRLDVLSPSTTLSLPDVLLQVKFSVFSDSSRCTWGFGKRAVLRDPNDSGVVRPGCGSRVLWTEAGWAPRGLLGSTNDVPDLPGIRLGPCAHNVRPARGKALALRLSHGFPLRPPIRVHLL